MKTTPATPKKAMSPEDYRGYLLRIKDLKADPDITLKLQLYLSVLQVIEYEAANGNMINREWMDLQIQKAAT